MLACRVNVETLPKAWKQLIEVQLYCVFVLMFMNRKSTQSEHIWMRHDGFRSALPALGTHKILWYSCHACIWQEEMGIWCDLDNCVGFTYVIQEPVTVSCSFLAGDSLIESICQNMPGKGTGIFSAVAEGCPIHRPGCIRLITDQESSWLWITHLESPAEVIWKSHKASWRIRRPREGSKSSLVMFISPAVIRVSWAS